MCREKGYRLKKTVFVTILLVLLASLAETQDDLKAKVFEIQYESASDIYKAVVPLKSPEGKVTLISKTHQIIVYDHPENIKLIGEVIAQLDLRKEQVEVHVIVEEVSQEILKRIGLTNGQAVLDPEKFSQIKYLIEKETSSKTRTELMVRTISGEPADIAVAQEKIYGGTLTSSMQRMPVPIIVTTTERDAGNFLEVLPRVNKDGTITVIVRPEVSEFTSDQTIHERSILTKVIVYNGYTIALGGVQSGRVEVEQQGVSETGVSVPTTMTETTVQTVMFLTVFVVE